MLQNRFISGPPLSVRLVSQTQSNTNQRKGLFFQEIILNKSDIQGEEVAVFLRHLLRQVRGHLIVLLDNGKTHRSDPVGELLARTSRLHLVPFPPYAPELNPDEGVWNHLKSTLANGRPDTQVELMDVLADEICRLAASQSLLQGCIQQSDLPPFLP